VFLVWFPFCTAFCKKVTSWLLRARWIASLGLHAQGDLRSQIVISKQHETKRDRSSQKSGDSDLFEIAMPLKSKGSRPLEFSVNPEHAG
jgi:esterase/lipase superfamily enzyme